MRTRRSARVRAMYNETDLRSKIERLQAENAKLREALEKIANEDVAGEGLANDAVDVAQQALYEALAEQEE